MSDRPAHLSLRLKHRQGTLVFDTTFELTEPWTVLFGPSGSGKTTVLRAIAGFIRPEAGRIVSGKDVLFDDHARAFVPAHERPVRTAGQTARLFPHMTVRQNVLYGAGWRSKPLEEFEIANEVLALFRLQDLSQRMPRDLSGGERQKVSVARAVVSAITFGGRRTALLLLDEPFAGLDLAMKDELLDELRQWLGRWKIPVLSVTHDVGEAFQLTAEVIKLAEGKVLQTGPAAVVLADERNRLTKQLSFRTEE